MNYTLFVTSVCKPEKTVTRRGKGHEDAKNGIFRQPRKALAYNRLAFHRQQGRFCDSAERALSSCGRGFSASPERLSRTPEKAFPHKKKVSAARRKRKSCEFSSALCLHNICSGIFQERRHLLIVYAFSSHTLQYIMHKYT